MYKKIYSYLLFYAACFSRNRKEKIAIYISIQPFIQASKCKLKMQMHRLKK